jgi:hypothetical protein
MFKMRYWDPEFSTTRMEEHDPFSNFAMINGLIVDLGSLPPKIQEVLQKEDNE